MIKEKQVPGVPVPLPTRIIEVRGVKVLLDADLAELYAVSTKALNQAIKRNRQKFPPDFMFRLTKGEKA
ncbi:MAG: ORF6N domain-containing protein, partial [Candidatus Binatia bacterium]